MLTPTPTRDQAEDEIGNPAPDNTGHRLPNAPLHAGSLWAKYAVIPERFELGAGVYLVGEREGNVENSFQTPGYGRVDAFAAYHWKIGPSRLTAQLNFNNVLDKEYFHSTALFGGDGQHPGEPLTVIGSLRVEF
ncbi:MAG: TonB-dependent receptor [Acidobacteria bacterium]|nr:TonB-dependent receptor [Acidobacteriota bacterium]